MKSLKKFLVLAICVSLIFSCYDAVKNEDLSELKRAELGADKTGATKMVTKPFKAEFYTMGAPDAFSTLCDGIRKTNNVWLLDHQVGHGEATHLGFMTYDATFCFCIKPKETFATIKDAVVTLTTANGDTLYLAPGEGGEVIWTPNDPDYAGYFTGEYKFDGGTGRFENVTGTGSTIGYLEKLESGKFKTHHTWSGTITLPNKQR